MRTTRRIQRIDRKDLKNLHLVYLPEDVLKEAGFGKGTQVDVSCNKNGVIELKRVEA